MSDVNKLELAARVGVMHGFHAVAVLDATSSVLALAGALDATDARMFGAEYLSYSHTDLVPFVSGSLGGRDVRVTSIDNRLIVVVVFPNDHGRLRLHAYELLHMHLLWSLPSSSSSDNDVPPFVPPSSGGGSSGPASLPVVELGITVPRGRN